MKIKSIVGLAGILTVSICAVIGQSQYSGIYTGTVPSKFTVALTKGGRGLGGGNKDTWRDELDPVKSTINASGNFKGVTPNGDVVTATVSGSDLKGTIKSDGETSRLVGKRVFN